MLEYSLEEYENELSTFGFDGVLDDDIVDKFNQLCNLHQMDAGDIVAEWVAFSHTKKTNMKLNMENLDMLERERLSRRAKKPGKNTVKPSSATIYTVDSLQKVVDVDTADELLGAYSTPNSKGGKKRQHTPDMVQNKRLTNIGRSPVVPFSPTSFSPSGATPSAQYSSRKNAGEVLSAFGAASSARWTSERDTDCIIQNYDNTFSLTERFKFMFQKMTEKAHVLNDLIGEMGETLKSHYQISDFSHLALPQQDETTYCGRVSCDSNGKINAQSLMLQGTIESSAGKQIPLDVSDIPQYSLFPGQVIALEGLNSTGNKLVAKKLYESLPPPCVSCEDMLPNGALTVVVAAGPFTTTESNLYEPLTDLLNYLHKQPPDVCILLGPFVDSKNQDIHKIFENTTYEAVFTALIDQIMNAVTRNTHIVIVPSQRDVHGAYVYPQPPFKLKMDSKRLHMVSDPCTLSIDGVVFGITSTDILFHLGGEEISGPAGGSDRLARLTKHIITQQSFYPLYPPNEEVNIDYEFDELHGKLPVTPHVLIVPSDFRYFIKEVCKCCCVNPGRLTKGRVAGSYARLRINRPASAAWTAVEEHVAAEILRI